MTTLIKDGVTVTVPADVVDDYVKQGWQQAGADQPSEPPKPATRSSKSTRRSKPKADEG